MKSQILVVLLALVIALLMAFKPEMFIPNPNHRTPTLVHSFKYIGMSVSLVFLIWLIITLTTGTL